MMEKNIDDCWDLDGERENYQMHGQASQDLFYWMKGHLMHIHGPGETHKETNNLKTWQCMARYVEAYFWCSENQNKAKMGFQDTKAR